MVVMNKKGEVIVAHNGRKELRLTFGKEGVKARSEHGWKAFYLPNNARSASSIVAKLNPSTT